ncbi:MAG: hypothetical protein ACJAV4_001214 [Pontimonas sp.]|jgi:hypothetical protein
MLSFREKLAPAWWLVLAVGWVIPATTLVFLPLNLALGVAIGVTLWAGAVGMLWLASPTISLEGNHLRAGRATVELRFVESAQVFRLDAAREQRGVALDARAWLVIRGWIGPVVKVNLDDPEDPVPYWLLSSRRPEEFLAALEKAKQTI